MFHLYGEYFCFFYVFCEKMAFLCLFGRFMSFWVEKKRYDLV